jgi:hypothetical protein
LWSEGSGARRALAYAAGTGVLRLSIGARAVLAGEVVGEVGVDEVVSDVGIGRGVELALATGRSMQRTFGDRAWLVDVSAITEVPTHADRADASPRCHPAGWLVWPAGSWNKDHVQTRSRAASGAR